MAVAIGKVVGANGNFNPMFRRKDGADKKLWGRRNVRAMASVSCGKLKEEYKLLRLKPNASEKEVKKAYRRLALQHHPDVCKGENCGVTFHKINEAYQIVMSTLMEVNKEEEYYANDDLVFVLQLGLESVMAVAVGKVVCANGNSNPMFGIKDGEDRKLWGRRNVRAMASVSFGKLKEEFKLLRLKPNSAKKEFMEAYRRLALQYHPHVCKGENYGACKGGNFGVTFKTINEAYHIVMSALMEINEEEEYNGDEGYMGFGEWEEWMGFEGGMPRRDYSNHISYYDDKWEEWMGFEGGCPSRNYYNHDINYFI
ncbi:uncharacterized protein LOC131033799 [Cryptomeria japonica]|uniref:uncharacterized protein LOC131033799 n=1 Tax=Cryptomeria japonica TaxID=3369 RepID=UPI0027DA0915|nr:uncharacterized protein LOC131033799 [Cryptomeria japonica]